MMGNDREVFLKNIRQALKAAPTTEVQQPLADDYTPARLVPADAVDLGDRFVRRAVEEGMLVYRLKNPPELITKILDLLKGLSLHKLLVADDPLLTRLGVNEALKNIPDVELRCFNKDDQDSLIKAAFTADAGIASAAWALAETGAIVLSSGPNQPRLLHLAPPVHICILAAQNIKADLLDLLRPENLQNSLTLVAGPSKTSDIEMKLVTGVHGPTAEHILLLESTRFFRQGGRSPLL